MKTKTKPNFLAMIFAIICSLFFFTKLNAQGPSCPFPITNNFGCQVTITYEIFSNGVSCGVSAPQNIAGHGGVLNITCAMFNSCGTGPLDIVEKILSIGTNSAPNPQAVSSNNMGPLYFGPCSGDPNISSSCYTGYSENIVWSATGVTIY